MAARKLKTLLRISNIYVGDAIANLLMIEAVLRDMDFGIADFSNTYQEYPSKMFKAVVSDRTAFKTTWDETRLVSPASLQSFIDRVVTEVKGGRAFVRPSGTEDILRLYVESSNSADINFLSQHILHKIETSY